MNESTAADLHEITDAISEGLLVTDDEGHIVFANPRACRLTGYAREELLGSNLHALLHVQEDGSRSPREQCRVLRTGNADRCVEETFRRKDGSLMVVETYTSPMSRPGGTISTFRDVTQLKNLQARLREETIRDPLTQLYNRRYLDDALERELVRARRQSSSLALMMADLDWFKRVNDTHGHRAGDRVLQALAQILLRHTRGSDICCRYGGEEFLVMLPGADAAQARDRAEQIRVALAEAPIAIEGASLRQTASFGIAAYPCNGVDADALIDAADAALYAAKQGGRNRVVVARALVDRS